MSKYLKWSVTALKSDLRSRGAKVTGRKNDLVERLESYDRNENFANDPVLLPPEELPNWPTNGFKQILLTHRALLPRILEGHITGYFCYRTACDEQANGDITALDKGRTLVDANRVETCSLCHSATDFFFSGIVRAMMKKKVSYSVRLKFTSSGELVNSDCECPAGAGPHCTCKHVAALAFVLHQFVDSGSLLLRQSCTDRLQSFHKPLKAYGGSPMKLQNLPRKRNASHILDDPRPEKFRNVAGYNDYVKSTVINYVAHTNHDLAIRYLYPKADLQAAVHDHKYSERPFTEYWVENAIQVTPSQATVIERETRNQAKSSKWLEEREMRLTASMFGAICHRTIRRNLDKLCEQIYKPQNLRTRAIIHGKIHEDDGLKSFTSVTGLSVVKAGLFVSVQYPYLAASPDGLVDITHVIEVKCPFVGRNMKISPGAAFPFLHLQDGKLALKRTHKYFDQVQGQMALTGRENAFFVVFTFIDTSIINVPFDSDYWHGSMLPKLQSFYERSYKKYVAKRCV